MENGHWQYAKPINPNNWFGFIYRIIEYDTGKEYIGKKQFHSYTKKKVKGRKNRKTTIKESAWKTYTGSSNELNSNINERGIENYGFFIESLHQTRGSLYYAEVYKQITENVLREKLDSGEKKYYNKNIAGVKFIPPEPTEIETVADITTYTPRNKTKSKSTKNTRLTYEEYYGIDSTLSLRQNLVEHDDETTTVKSKYTEEQKEKWRTDDRRKHYGEKNGMYGKPAYYKMTEEEKAKWKKNVGDAGKGKKKPVVVCPHCGKEGGKPPMTRFHFDNCKFKNS